MTLPKAEQIMLAEMVNLVTLAKTCVINKEYESKVKETDDPQTLKNKAKQTLIALIHSL